MEDTLGVSYTFDGHKLYRGLNPCSNGRYSRSIAIDIHIVALFGLNPCSNGRYSRSRTKKFVTLQDDKS